jgi:hypothetical protein
MQLLLDEQYSNLMELQGHQKRNNKRCIKMLLIWCKWNLERMILLHSAISSAFCTYKSISRVICAECQTREFEPAAVTTALVELIYFRPLVLA